MNNIKTRIEKLLQAMSVGAYEREEVIALSLLAAIAGESIFLLGMPGVGKSMVARRLKLAFAGARSFEYLMSRFSTPDEIFGPVSITKLKDEDTYERVIDGYLPTADVVFLDEIWKAGPAIQNSLLTALNERIFHNGKEDIKLPLKTIISASNELPAEDEGLEALWDRFLIRYIVRPISSRDTFLKLLMNKEEACDIKKNMQITEAEFATLQRQKEQVVVPHIICDIICDIRDILADEEQTLNFMPTVNATPYVSDRRWRKIMGILRTSALLNGRTEVDPSDCLLLENLLWDSDDQVLGIKKLVAHAIVNRISKNLPKSVSIDDFEHFALTEPVGELFSPDGKHYVFTAGGEDILIDKSDYDTLTERGMHGDLTDDNRLILSAEKGFFTVRRKVYGQIILNTFTYILKADSPLRTGNVNTMLKSINAKAETLISTINTMVDANIFLRSHNEYPELQQALERTKFTEKDIRLN